MKHVKRSVLLWYSAHEMYALVTAIQDYPKFLPWCDRAEVIERHEDGVTARLHLAFAGVRQAFTTRNVEIMDSGVEMTLVDGPFSTLHGTWRFTPVRAPGEDSAAAAQACRIDFELTYHFSSRALAVLISPVFDRIADTFVDAFVQRAQAVYGAR